jgi:16S rRNA (cytidine1402-2'-O)-methyltransferase
VTAVRDIPSARAAGTLFVVATPIGNLEDITVRALRVLREVDVIAAEDTRRTAHLLARHGIATPTISFHAHNTSGRIPQLMERLTAGASIALVSDAGTPGLSDPGTELIETCIRTGIVVDPIPGPSAPLAAVVASGFPVIPLTILGFVPSKANDRSAWMAALSKIQTTTTFFEAPHRIARTLTELTPYLGKRQIVVAREVTKVHQEFLRGTAAALAAELHSARGEITVVVSPPERVAAGQGLPDDDEIARCFEQIPETEVGSRGQRLSLAARRLGIPRRLVFEALERKKVLLNDKQ